MFIPSLIILLSLTAQIWARTDFFSDVHMHPNLGRSFAVNPDETSSQYWIDKAQSTIRDKLSQALNQNIAKNIILFLGDGMSVPTLAAARAYLGGEELQLSFDKFPYTALSKTYAVDKQVADSANTATAYLGGVKGNYGTIGVSGAVQREDCEAMSNVTNHVLSIAYQAQQAQKMTGVVTTAKVTDASPAGVYAHTANRIWESDLEIVVSGKDPKLCPDIASQLVYGETGVNLNIVLGGGKQAFLPWNVLDEEGNIGHRLDGVNLIDAWLQEHSDDDPKYVYNREQLLALDTNTQRLLGLFAAGSMDYNIERDPEMDPSLVEMTETAINILSQNPNGYFLFVEGALIDHGHHENKPRKALNETIEFSKAIQRAVELTDESDTLIVVTADHAHTMTYSGYAPRGNNILEFGGTGIDGLVYTTLNYANGPGFRHEENGNRPDFSQNDLDDLQLTYPSIAPLLSETHGGDDVAVFARGPWSHLFSGVIEENVIPHIMMYASCIGQGARACDD